MNFRSNCVDYSKIRKFAEYMPLTGIVYYRPTSVSINVYSMVTCVC